MPDDSKATSTDVDVEEEKEEYVPQKFKVKFDGVEVPFISVERFEVIKEGKTTTKRPYDFFKFDAETIEDKGGRVVWLLKIHEAQVKGAGHAHLDKLIDHLVEHANENMLDPETNTLSTALFGAALVKPIVRSTVSYNS